MRSGDVVRIGGEFYRLCYRDPGTLRPEDKDLWRAWKVTWDGDHFGIHDDDDYLLSDDGKVIARETVWNLRREEI